MDVYVCSTVRHVLFALLRASAHPDEPHHVLYFADFQNAPLDGWNLGALSPQIHVHTLQRAAFRDALGASRRGRLIYFLAMRNLPAPAALLDPLWKLLERDAPELAAALASSADPQLWLFNERNKMARVLRLLMPRFQLLEEGEANYHFVACPWWKWPARLLLGRPPRNRCYGEDPRCTAIHVLQPERLPAAVRPKAQAIKFLDQDHVKTIMHALFPAALFPQTQEHITVLATQPLQILDGVTLADKQRLYGQIATLLRGAGREVRLKLHPAEEPEDYLSLQGSSPLVSGKLPIEALIMAAETQLDIVSLWSTAGLGFEHNCRRLPLITVDHQATLRRWLRDDALIAAAVQAVLAT